MSTRARGERPRKPGKGKRATKRSVAGRADREPVSASALPLLETPSKTPTQPGKHGGQLRVGNPGNKGGGRPPSGLKEHLAELRSDPKALKALTTAARNAKSKGFPVAWKLAERYDPERPSEKHDVNVTIGIAERMRRAEERLKQRDDE